MGHRSKTFARSGRVIGIGLIVLSGFLIPLPGCVHRARRQEPYTWQLRGAVVAIQGTTLSVRHKSGRVVKLMVDDSTIYIRDRQPDSLQSLVPGRRVTIDVEVRGGSYRALRIQIFGPRRKASGGDRGF